MIASSVSDRQSLVHSNVWRLAIIAISLFAALLIILAFRRSFVLYDINYNEGWNAYFQNAAENFQNIYSNNSPLVVCNYPPLSFYFIGLFAREIDSDVVLVGRLVSIFSAITVAGLAGVIGWLLDKHSIATGIMAAALALAIQAMAFSGYLGMNDPQFLAEAIMMGGFALYVWQKDSRIFLIISISLIFLGGLFKHSGISIPVSVAVDCYFFSRSRFILFIVTSIFLIIFSYILLNLAFSDVIWHNLTSPRLYSFAYMINTAWYTERPIRVFILVSALAFGRILTDPRFRIAIIYGVVSVAAALIEGLGEGTWINMYFDAVVAGSLTIALAIGTFGKTGSAGWQGQVRGRRDWLAALVLIVTVFGSLPLGAWGELQSLRIDPKLEANMRDSVSYLSARPGNAICINLLLCYRAHKRFEFDPFNAGQYYDKMQSAAPDLAEFLRAEDIETVEETNDLDVPNRRQSERPLAKSFNAIIASDYAIDRKLPLMVFYARKAKSADSGKSD